MKIDVLNWDSNFFDLKIGKTEVSKKNDFDFLHIAKNNGFDLIYLFGKDLVVPKDVLSFYNGKKVDSKIVFNYGCEDSKVEESPIDILEYKSDFASKELISLGIQSGEYSRFRIDANFDKGLFEALYHRWILNSVNKKFADYIFVKEKNKKVIGFVTFKIDHSKNSGTIGLIAVDEVYRGMKIGKKLIDKIKAISHQHGLKEINVATQKDNLGACNFYKKYGFKIKSRTDIYHFWLKENT